MPQISRARALAYGLAVLLLLVLGGRFALGRDEAAPASSESSPAALTEEGRAGAADLEATGPPERIVLVHVVGAVRRPGLYRLREGSRIADALRRAGGARPRAALELVNLAAPVADGQQILVPRRGAAAATVPTAPGTSAGQGAAVAKVHLNSATLEQLDTLPGVGPITAQKILDYRTAHGAFQSVEELDAVPGIGPATLAELEPLVEL